MVGLFALWWVLPVAEWVLRTARFIQDLGPWGIAAYAFLYIVAILALAPGTMLTLAGGFIWGPLVGTLIAWPTATVASTTAFLVGRYLAHEQAERIFGRRPLFLAVVRAVERDGIKIIALLRLSPVMPFNFFNYAFGLTRLRVRTFALGNVIGILPNTVLYAYLGSLAKSVTELGSGGAKVPGALYWIGLLITVGVALFVARSAKRALDEQAFG